MITIHKVAADTKYYSKDEYYRKEKEGEELGLKKWIYGQENLKKFNLDSNIIKDEKIFETFVKKGIGSKRMIGQDLTFSSPKSLSIAAGIGNEQIRKDVVDAHHYAVEKTLDYISKNLIFTRHTVDKTTVHVKGKDMFAINFDHILSRSADPQLHTHSIIANIVTRSTDGALRKIDFKATLQGTDRQLLDVLMKNFESEYLENKGYKVEWSEDGKTFELAGITREQIEVFSQREQQVLQYAEMAGLDMSDPKQRTKAILETRQYKGKINMETIVQDWKETAERLGISIENILPSKEQGQELYRQYDQRADMDIAKQVMGTMTGVFQEHEFLAKMIQVSRAMKRKISMDEAIKTIRNMQKERDVVYLGTADGREYYTTKAFLQHEKNILEAIKKTAQSKELNPHILEQFKKEFEKEKGFWLSSEQEKAMLGIFKSEHKIIGIQGYAGVGKSAMMEAIKKINGDQKDKEGKYFTRVVGLAPTGKAAAELREKGLETTTIDHLFAVTKVKEALQKTEKIEEAEGKELDDIEKEDIIKNVLQDMQITREEIEYAEEFIDKKLKGSLVIVDEFSMIDVAKADALISYLEKAGVEKIVASGDIRQFQSIQSGKAFAVMQEAGMETYVLKDIIRQKDNPKLLSAVKDIANDKIPDALAKIPKKFFNLKENKIKMDEVLEEITDAFVKKYIQDREKKTYIITPGNQTAEKLNALIVGKLREIENRLYGNAIATDVTTVNREQIYKGQDIFIKNGEKKVKEIILKWGEKKEETGVFREGDRIIFLHSDKKMGIENGEKGCIQAIDKRKMTVKTEFGKIIEVDIENYNSFRHAYALTAHKSQGATMNDIIYFVNTTANLYKNAVYVALSRAKHSAKIYSTLSEKEFEKLKWQENKSAFETSQRVKEYKEILKKIREEIKREETMQSREKRPYGYDKQEEKDEEMRYEKHEKKEKNTERVIKFESQIEKIEQQARAEERGISIGR